MGNKNSQKQNNDELKKIGEDANKSFPSTFSTFSQINLTTDLIIGKFKTDPEEDYQKVNFLGEGAFSSVYKVENRYTEAICAMKVIKKSNSRIREDEIEILNEINILRTMDHPGILKLFEFYSNKQTYSIVTELCPGGELFQQILDKGPFKEKYTAFVMYQLLSAVNYCHQMHIVHRDLKPENILIVGKEKEGFPLIKICDFGTSRMFEKGSVQRKIVGSSYYIAPEVLKKHYNEKCDIWSCGVIMYILLSSRPPFEGDNDDEIMENVAEGNYDLESSPFNKLSKNSIDLIKRLLTMDPEQRITAEQALNHPWFKEFKIQEKYNKINDKNTMKTLINNLKTYRRTSIIQETALAYLVHHFPQIKDVVNSCKLFNQIDKNGDGKISKAELLNGFSERYTSDTLESDVEEIYKILDMDNNGYIEYEEFVRAACSKEYFVKDNVLRFAFKYFDKDGSGEITFDEIEDLFSQSIPDKTKVRETLKNIIIEVDINQDGKITYDEFCKVMKRMLR